MKMRVLLVLATSCACLLVIPSDSENRASAGLFRGRKCRNVNEADCQVVPLHEQFQKQFQKYGATGGQIRVIGTDGVAVLPNDPNSTVITSTGRVRVEIDVTMDPGWTVAPKLLVFNAPAGATGAPFFDVPLGALPMVGPGGSGVVTYALDNVVVTAPTIQPPAFNNFIVIWVVSDSGAQFHQVHRLPPFDMATTLGWKIKKQP